MNEKTRRFEEMALPHLDAAYNLARWLTHSNQDAEDVVQEAYLRAFRYFDAFRGGNGRAWLMATVRNTCYTWIQRNRPPQAVYALDEERDGEEDDGAPADSNPAHGDPELLLSRRDDKQLIDRALAQLPLEFREVLILREMEDLSYKEIASIAEIPLGTVMSRLARARKLLHRVVKQMHREP